MPPLRQVWSVGAPSIGDRVAPRALLGKPQRRYGYGLVSEAALGLSLLLYIFIMLESKCLHTTYCTVSYAGITLCSL